MKVSGRMISQIAIMFFPASRPERGRRLAQFSVTFGQGCMDHGQFMRIGADGLQIAVLAIRQFDVPENPPPRPSIIACTHQSCHRQNGADGCQNRPAQAGYCPQTFAFSQTFVMARAYSTCSSNLPRSFVTARERNSISTASPDFPQHDLGPAAPNVSSYCPCGVPGDRRQAQPFEPLLKSGGTSAVCRKTCCPRSQVLSRASRKACARDQAVHTQLAFIHQIGKTNRRAAVDQAEGHCRVCDWRKIDWHIKSL